jgi:hypothetical protein
MSTPDRSQALLDLDALTRDVYAASVPGIASRLRRRAAAVGSHPPAQDIESEDQESFRATGERLFALVDEARLAHVDPELALRAAAQRFRETIGER